MPKEDEQTRMIREQRLRDDRIQSLRRVHSRKIMVTEPTINSPQKGIPSLYTVSRRGYKLEAGLLCLSY